MRRLGYLPRLSSALTISAILCGIWLVAGCSSGGASDGGDGGTLGTSCDPTAFTDTVCAPNGYVCQGSVLPDGGVTGSCMLPGDQNACLTTVGCSPGFSCVPMVFDTGPTCVQQCKQSSDCTSAVKICEPQIISSTQSGCVFAGCGMGVDYYSVCNAEGTGDGTCIPFIFNETTVLGLCIQGGSIGLNQSCASDRGVSPGLCQPGSVCVQFTVSSGGAPVMASACRPFCTASPPPAADGGPGCDSQSSCANIFTDVTYGACFQNCTIGQPNNCPAPLVCLDLGGGNNTGGCGPG
jgi:hypothetical protein